MSGWVRWLIVAVAVVVILALLGYARGERQRGEDVETATSWLTVHVAEAEI